MEIWLGGLFTPEAYLTATRQCAAQSLHVSLEELIMHVQMLNQSLTENSNKENRFLITGNFDRSYYMKIKINEQISILFKFRLEITRCFMS